MSETFAGWLVRTRGNMSKRKLEGLSGVSSGSLTMLEQGNRNPSRDMVERLARGLGVDSAAGLAAAGFRAVDQGGGDPPPMIRAGLEIVVDLRDGPRYGTLTEASVRAIAELLETRMTEPVQGVPQSRPIKGDAVRP